MPTESAFLLAGLLFVAAALGYVFAKFGESESSEELSDRLSDDYLKGLNYVLNEEPDRAVELFTRMAELDDETLETHFALGSLFRKRGEVDRAIRVHQNLMARPNLTRAQKDQAEAALAEDYLSAGLLDRAESLFLKLRESSEIRRQALNRLIRIYELTREWNKAIEIHKELSRIDATAVGPEHVAHYFCELAAQAIAEKDFAGAREMLDQADAGRDRTVRSTLIRADIAHETGHQKEAIHLYQNVAKEAPNLLVEIIPRLAISAESAGLKKEFARFLKMLLDGDKERASAVAMATVLEPSIDEPIAINALQELVSNDPSLNGLIDASRLECTDDPERLKSLEEIRATLKSIVAAGPRYRCTSCGYVCLILQWQCPGCRSWETIKPETRIRLISSP